jgi:hypothetical protein
VQPKEIARYLILAAPTPALQFRDARAPALARSTWRQPSTLRCPKPTRGHHPGRSREIPAPRPQPVSAEGLRQHREVLVERPGDRDGPAAARARPPPPRGVPRRRPHKEVDAPTKRCSSPGALLVAAEQPGRCLTASSERHQSAAHRARSSVRLPTGRCGLWGVTAARVALASGPCPQRDCCPPPPLHSRPRRHFARLSRTRSTLRLPEAGGETRFCHPNAV